MTTMTFIEMVIKDYEKIGLRVVGIYLPSNAVGIPWTRAYPDPEFRWSTTELEIKQDRYAFDNTATMLGRTHIKDPETGEFLNLNALDIDSQTVNNRVCISIEQLLAGSTWDWVTDRLQELVKSFLSSAGVTNGDYGQSLLDVLKKSTFITKTRKVYGYHIYWLSKQQRNAVGSGMCKPDRAFEIKTDKSLGLCTLPGSAHKDDLNFRYKSVGITDRILPSDILYDVFFEMFRDCLSDNYSSNSKLDDVNVDVNNGSKEQTKPRPELMEKKQIKNLINLSPSMITATVGYLSGFIVKGYRNDFYVRFSGMLFHSRISDESGTQIIAGLCAKTADEESRARQRVLTETYEKGFSGEEIEGAPKLAELLANTVKGVDLVAATVILENLKTMWRSDKKAEQQRKEKTLVIKTIAQAKRMQSGYVRVRGSIVGMSTVYQMFKSTTLSCEECSLTETTTYQTPQYKPHITKERTKCPEYSKDTHNRTESGIAEYEYVSTVDIWLQDMDELNDLNRLQVKLFDNNTYDVNTGEIVDTIGRMRVIRNNDSLMSKPECVLYAEDLVYAKRKEVSLTPEDIEKLERLKADLKVQGKSIIDEAIRRIGPEMIGYNHVKKGILVQCANSGIKNDPKRNPIRMKINVLFIGDLGTAKGALSSIALKLIPNCQSVNGIASSGVSLIAVVDKNKDGAMSVNLGPLALAKSGIARINEIGRLKIDQQPHLFDAMEEGTTNMVKYGFPANIECHASILATANPLNNKWKHHDKITVEEFPILPQVTHRFDLIYVFRERRDDEFIEQYCDTRSEVEDNYRHGFYDYDLEWLQKYIAYARSFNPVISKDVRPLLKHFLKQIAKTDVDGLFRKYDTLLRISIALARLRLKSVVEVEDVREMMGMVQLMLGEFKAHVGIPREPRDAAYEEIRQVVKETHNIVEGGIEFTEAIKRSCERNDIVKSYLTIEGDTKGDYLKPKHNFKLRPILELLRKNPHIGFVGERPIVMKWIPEPHISQSKERFGDASDASDVYFSESDPEKSEDIQNISKDSREVASPTSPTSPRIYRKWDKGDRWCCHDCNVEGDRFCLEDHRCRG